MPLLADQALREVLIDYLKGESLGHVKNRIEKHIKGEKSGYRIYNSKLFAYSDEDKPEETHPLTNEFLRLLRIDKDEKEYHLLISLSLYQILTRLKGRHGHLDKLIEIIHEVQEPQSWTWTIISTILTCTGIGVFLYFYPQFFWMFVEWFTRVFPAFVRWLCLIFTEIPSVAVIGMAWQSGVLIYQWYNTFKYGPHPSPDSLRSLLFKTLGIAMNISGNVLMYLAHGSLGPIAAILFIACSFMDVLETINLLFIKYETPTIDVQQSLLKGAVLFKLKQAFPIRPLSMDELAYHACLDKLRERDLNILWIKLAATAFITISIILWCTLPSSMVLSLSFLIFGLLINLAKDQMVKRISHRYAEELQTALRIIYKDDPKIVTAAKNEFAGYTMQKIDSYRHNTAFTPHVRELICAKLNEERIRLIDAINFSLDSAKEKFDQAETIIFSVFTCTPQIWAKDNTMLFYQPPNGGHRVEATALPDIENQSATPWTFATIGV